VHELTLAQQIAAKVIDGATTANAKNVVSVDIAIGDLAFLDPASMEMWVREGLRDSAGKDAVINIDIIKSTLTCRGCGFAGRPDLPEHHDHHMPLPAFSCPHCGSSDISLDEQRDCLLKRIELEV